MFKNNSDFEGRCYGLSQRIFCSCSLCFWEFTLGSCLLVFWFQWFLMSSYVQFLLTFSATAPPTFTWSCVSLPGVSCSLFCSSLNSVCCLQSLSVLCDVFPWPCLFSCSACLYEFQFFKVLFAALSAIYFLNKCCLRTSDYWSCSVCIWCSTQSA